MLKAGWRVFSEPRNAMPKFISHIYDTKKKKQKMVGNCMHPYARYVILIVRIYAPAAIREIYRPEATCIPALLVPFQITE